MNELNTPENVRRLATAVMRWRQHHHSTPPDGATEFIEIYGYGIYKCSMGDDKPWNPFTNPADAWELLIAMMKHLSLAEAGRLGAWLSLDLSNPKDRLCAFCLNWMDKKK